MKIFNKIFLFRFDAELSTAQEEIKKEKLLREKFMREKDQIVHEKYSLEQDLQVTYLTFFVCISNTSVLNVFSFKICFIRHILSGPYPNNLEIKNISTRVFIWNSKFIKLLLFFYRLPN